MSRTTIIQTIVITSLWLCSAETLRAEEIDYAALAQSRATAVGAATAAPISEAEIIGKLETPTGSVFHFKIRDGGMLRVIDEENDVTHGFVARRQDSESETVLLHQYLIELHPSGGGEVVTSLDRTFSTSPSEKALTDEGYFFELLEIGNQEAAPFTQPLFPQPPEEQPICCISCGGSTVCGCSVSACGASCCSGACCGGGNGGPGPANKGP